MDKAPDFGSGDCRFESCHSRLVDILLVCLKSFDSNEIFFNTKIDVSCRDRTGDLVRVKHT